MSPQTPVPPLTAVRLAYSKAEVLLRWEAEVRAQVPSAQGEHRIALLDHIPNFLDELVEALAMEAMNRVGGERTTACIKHAQERKGEGDYSLTDALKEYELLHRVIMRVLEASGPVSSADREVIDRAIHRGVQTMASVFIKASEASEAATHESRERIRRLAAELQQQARTFDSILSLVPNFVWILDPACQFVYANAALLKALQLDLEQVIGQTYEDLVVAPQLGESLREEFAAVLTGAATSGETAVRDACGGQRFYAYNLLPVTDESGRAVAICGINHDITERKKIEAAGEEARSAAEEANRAKSSFLANMSHEIRTPLGAMLGFSELLKDPQLPAAERGEFLEAIVRNGRQLAQLVDDILDLSKVEAGRMEVERIPLELGDIVKDILQLLSVKAREQGIVLRAEVDGRVPRRIESDPARLRQTLINVVGNAIKFTGEGEVVVNLSLAASAATGGKRLYFTVRDTGRGIASHDQEHLFQPFMQGDSSTTRTFGGTGLGLGLSRRLARLLGGDVVLTRSVLGEGSTFTISIDPGAVSAEWISTIDLADGHAHLRTSHQRPQSKRLAGLRLLVAEDAPDNRFLIRRFLAGEGAIVDMVENGAEAVAKAQASVYDAMLMDIQMPVLDGYQATIQLRQKGVTTPIIALTAHAMKDEGARSLRAGCDDHLTKPISRDLVVTAVLRHVKNKDRS